MHMFPPFFVCVVPPYLPRMEGVGGLGTAKLVHVGFKFPPILVEM